MVPGVCWCVFFLVHTLNLSPAEGYRNGKVAEACGSMLPKHGHHANTTHSPYSLAVNSTTFSPGDHISVTLSGTTYFEGFLLQARDATNQNTDAVGSFRLTNPDVSQLLTCNFNQGSAVSHKNDDRQREVLVVWTAPPNAPKVVQFLVTVVAHYSIYWVKIPGPVIYQGGVTPLPPRPTPTPAPSHPPTPSVLPGRFSSEACGVHKSCLLDPVGCDPEVDPQCYFLSWSTLGQTVQFELSGPAEGSVSSPTAEGYVAFALSRDTWMGDDDVYLCVRDGDMVDVNTAFVSGRTHPVYSSQGVLSDVVWRVEDGVVQCRFRRPILVPQDPTRFSLDQQYYVFMAHGQAQYGKVHKHVRQPLVSSQRAAMTGLPQVLSGSRSPTIIKYHGVLMLLAWMLAGSTGIFLASYYRTDWPEKSLLGQKLWFQVHRGLMVMTVLLTAVAFTLPFIYRGGWSKGAGVHPFLGCSVMALAVLQPIVAAFRPPPDSARRWAFNWLHWGAGTAAEILAVAAMFLGVRQQALLLPLPWATWVLIGYLLWGVVLRLLLTLHKRGCIKTPTASGDQQMIMSVQGEGGGWDSLLKMAALPVLVLGNFGFLVSLLSGIAAL